VPVERRKSRSIMKQTTVARGPQLLCLHLPRSTLFYGEAGKNACAVQFGQVLDLSVAYARNHWLPSNLSKASSHNTQYDTVTTGRHYQLTAVVEHLGSHMSGHFITYRRVRSFHLLASVNAPSSIPNTAINDRWFRVSDQHVEPITLDQVLTAQAYMLFYEQQDDT
jgi:ubiquitin carboxyl-terminal hydrolase 1